MRSIKRRFDNIAERNPYKSSYTHFTEAIKGRDFSQQAIHRWFYKLVDKNDYKSGERKEILAHLDNLTKPREDDKK